MRTRLLIIIPAALQEAANAFAATLDPAGGSLTFTDPLFPDGQHPQGEPSHYWCSASVSEETLAAIQEAAPGFPGAEVLEYDSVRQPTFPNDTLANLSLERPDPPPMP